MQNTKAYARCLLVLQLIAEGSAKLSSVPSGGAVAASGGAAAGGAGAAAAAEEKEEEKKEEEKVRVLHVVHDPVICSRSVFLRYRRSPTTTWASVSSTKLYHDSIVCFILLRHASAADHPNRSLRQHPESHEW